MNNYRIKKTVICKDINEYRIDKSICKTYQPVAGDVALFEILKLGKHITLEDVSGRYATIIEGDTILATYGTRYATSQFEGYVPEKPTEINDILAIGGVVGIVKSKHEDFKHIPPTQVRLLGYAVDKNGKVMNSKNYKTKHIPFTGHIPNNATVILSVGSTMESGKTFSAGFLSRGLKTTGKKVAYIKLTGTANTKDKDVVYDCGADVTIDFSDIGFPSTYMCDKEEILDLYQTLLNQLEHEKPDFIVIEIADGLVERETDFLLRSKRFMGTIDHIALSSSDSLAAFYGIDHLTKLGMAPTILSGCFTMSPLLVEEVRSNTTIPALTIEQLMSGQFAELFIHRKALANRL